MPLPTNLQYRKRQPEIMDQSGLDDAEHRQALDALRRINRLSGGDQALWPLIQDYCRGRRDSHDMRPVRLLDVATGGGDLPVRLWKKARRAGLNLEVAGCDRSTLAVEYAQAHAGREQADVIFFRYDAIAEALPAGYHILISSLFLHHLSEPEVLGFLRALGSAGELVLIDDLRRGLVGWVLAYLGIRLLSRSRVARVDGPISVEGAFTCDEALALARQAGWNNVEVRSRWPCRFLMIGRHP
jgi:2-polyprenyl-3-methyl-5-hydroxy-6-metoxy-1,4-benzoquinol methylase